MNRKRLWRNLLLLAVLLLMIPAGGAQAAARKYFDCQGADYPIDVYGVTFEAKTKQYGNEYLADIVRTENGVSKTLLTKVNFAFVTNGIYLYYSKPVKKVADDNFGSSYNNTIYRYTIKSGKSKKLVSGVTINLQDTPDALPALSVAAAFAEGDTTFTGLAHVRVKETDRVAVMQEELSKMGADIEIGPDYMVVHGGKPLHGATVESHGDHRIAMAMTVKPAGSPSAVTFFSPVPSAVSGVPS